MSSERQKKAQQLWTNELCMISHDTRDDDQRILLSKMKQKENVKKDKKIKEYT